MSVDIDKRVNVLSNAQAVAACDALILLLGDRLKKDEEVSGTAKASDLVDYENLLESAGPPENKFLASLQSDKTSDVEVAGAARAMLLLASDMGFTDLVEAALAEGETHVRDLGVVSGAIILGALAVILASVPVEQRKTVYTKRQQRPDGTWIAEDVSEIYERRIGAEAVKAFLSWVKVFVPLGGE